MNILACWCRLTKIIFRALLNENCISKAVINALNLLECESLPVTYPTEYILHFLMFYDYKIEHQII